MHNLFIIDNKEWLYLAKYINQPLPRNYAAHRPRVVSDASLLELVAPINRISISADATQTVRFSIRSNHKLVLRDRNRVDNALLGLEFTPKPLRLPSMEHASRAERDGADKPEHIHLQVEQVVQMCGYGAHTKVVDCNWARVVQRQEELYVVSVYSEQHTAGGPVLDNAGSVVGVISAHPYKKGNYSAIYLASLNDIEVV